jgi:alpha-L-rhamnosidase
MATGEGDSMLSFNHYAYGAVAEWLYRTVAGLSPDSHDPGYATVVFAPVPGGGLTHARARINTPFGPASIAWQRAAEELTVDLEVPPGARGRFIPPPGNRTVRHGDEELGLGALPVDTALGRPAVALSSGDHHLVLT